MGQCGVGSEVEAGERINVVIVPDGYTYAEKALLQSNADALVAPGNCPT